MDEKLRKKIMAALDVADRILLIPEIAERFKCDCGMARLVGSCTGYCDRDD